MVIVDVSVMEGLAVGVIVIVGISVLTASSVAEAAGGGGGVSVSVGLGRFSLVGVVVGAAMVAASMSAVGLTLGSRAVSEGESSAEGLSASDELSILPEGAPEVSLVVAPSAVSLGSGLGFSSADSHAGVNFPL